MIGIKGNLTMIGLNTLTQKVFWNGAEVLGIKQIKVEVEGSERVVKLLIEGTNDSMYMEMIQAGVQVKKQKGKA